MLEQELKYPPRYCLLFEKKQSRDKMANKLTIHIVDTSSSFKLDIRLGK